MDLHGYLITWIDATRWYKNQVLDHFTNTSTIAQVVIMKKIIIIILYFDRVIQSAKIRAAIKRSPVEKI